MKYSQIIVFFLSLALFSCKTNNNDTITSNTIQDAPLKFEVETIVDNLENPWSFTFLPDGSILINELKGELILFKNNVKSTINNLPDIIAKGQGGLMDIELDPDYANNRWIYFSFSSDIEMDGNGANTTIMRAKLVDNSLVEKTILYKATPNTNGGNHFGSRIEFDKNGYLYFSIGDRFQRDINPQDITKDGGKIYRINPDGSIPTNNPFYNTSGAKKAIYSYGHRNPQGIALHPETGKIWTHEHGPQGGDEINIIKPGVNYGWPKASFGINYDGTTFTDATSLPNIEDPIHYWTPSIAPCGMTFVTSDKYPQWEGNILVGSLKFQYLNRCILDGDKVIFEEKLLEDIGRVRCIRQGPDGFIYISVQNKGVLKLVPTI